MRFQNYEISALQRQIVSSRETRLPSTNHYRVEVLSLVRHVHSHAPFLLNCGSRPSCTMRAKRSGEPQCSTILPFSNRHTSMTVMVIILPVGGPINGPRLVPRAVMRSHTLSHSAAIFSIVK